MLIKYRSLTKDNKGCEFNYTCYVEKNYKWEKGNRTYIDDIFNFKTKSLKELKNKMTNSGKV